MSFQKVTLIGNVGAEPEARFTKSGTPVTNFRVATSETWNDKDGKRQERTEWHRIVTWGRLAEVCEKWVTKGRLILIEGRLQTRQWEDNDGNKRYTTEIVAQEMKLLGKAPAPKKEEQKEPPLEKEIPTMDDDAAPF